MSQPKVRYSLSVVVVAAAAVTCVTVAALVGLVIFEPKGQDTTPVVTSILGFTSTVVIGLLALLKADKLEQHVHHLANGGRKIRATDLAQTPAARGADAAEQVQQLRQDTGGQAPPPPAPPGPSGF